MFEAYNHWCDRMHVERSERVRFPSVARPFGAVPSFALNNTASAARPAVLYSGGTGRSHGRSRPPGR